MSGRYYTIKATKVDRAISPLEKGFYNSHGIPYEVKEGGELSSHPELTPAMRGAIANLASDNIIPHKSLTLTLELEE